MAAFDENLLKTLSSANPQIAGIVQPFIEGRGKRLRPMLVYLSSGACECRNDPLRTRYAVITELIHTASLFHDDVLDNASRRRGKASANRLLGNHLSILAGDYLYIKALAMAGTGESAIQKRVNQTVLAMTEGEIAQSEQRFRFDGGIPKYLSIIERKTAHLTATACFMGASISNNPDYTEALTRFGHKVGMTFQIIDDLLDWTADGDLLGKDLFLDAREGLFTLPVFLLREKLPPAEKSALDSTLLDSDGHRTNDPFMKIREQMKRYGVIEDVKEFAKSLADESLNALEILPPTPERNELNGLVPLLLDRMQ